MDNILRCVIISRQVDADPWNFENLIQMVEKEREARERASGHSAADPAVPT